MKRAFCHFLEFDTSDGLDIVYWDSTKCFLTFGKVTSLWRIIQKSQKCIFEWSKEPKKYVLGHFLEFGLLDRLDIAYCDSTNCFPTFGKVTRSWRIIQKSNKWIFEWSKEPKKEVFGHFLKFGQLDRLDIAYYDSTKCFSPFGSGNKSCICN